MIRLSALIGAVALVLATSSSASNADMARGDVATVQDPYDTPDSHDHAKRQHASKPEANDAGVEDSGAAWPQDTTMADEGPPNQNSPDDGPRQPKSGCSSSGPENGAPWEATTAIVALSAIHMRRRRSGRAR
jgi:hypothetical protein